MTGRGRRTMCIFVQKGEFEALKKMHFTLIIG